MDLSPHATDRPWDGRAVIHMDLDAFFAAVEQLDHPEWRGRPVIVGGDPDRRGVVSTCSYEARAFGVRSAMPSSRARVLCPDAIWTAGNFDRYREMSAAVMDILRSESPFIQQTSIDEAFLDVTPDRVKHEHPIAVARRIRSRIAALGITCSIGVATSKTVAKIGSDHRKPDGLTAVYPGDEAAFLAPLPVRALSGIGPKSGERLHALGVETLGDLASLDPSVAQAVLGSRAHELVARAAGTDHREVHDREPVKSVSNERSFAVDLTDRQELHAALDTMSAKVGARLRRKGLAGRTVTVKVKDSEFHTSTTRTTLESATDDEGTFGPVARALFDTSWRPGVAVRLVGVGVSGFEERTMQPSLFDAPDRHDGTSRNSRELALGLDEIRRRFGDSAVMFGRELRFKRRTTGTGPQDDRDSR